MIFVFYLFAAVLIFLGYKSLRGGIYYLQFFKQELAKPKSNFTPFASVIAPCRGLDQGLHENLTALFSQNYPNYEVIFVVDAERDESVKIVEEVSRKGAQHARSKLAVAGKATDSSQKVHNLREAVLEVSGESEIFVFVDSDARPSKDWLKNLIAPLQNKEIGCATGYRWFISKRGGFSSQFRAVWNASIASTLGANQENNFCWGGSTAIRRETFEKLEMREKWRGALSDDFAVTRAMQQANLPICFVPQCLTATIEDCTFRELLEFTTRQMKITRVYAPNLWKASFVGSFFFTAIFWSGVLLLFFLSDWHFWLTFVFIIVIFLLGATKAWLRLSAVKLVLIGFGKELNRQFLWQITLWTISPTLYFYNCFWALLSRKIVWRGIEYNLLTVNSTEILSDSRQIK
ncbi:MAG TPA: glycosyltransferase family 2 protein [Pyrinomonadaceae bacterium]|nr:glycosyltransferase family 2 protein [Pyrinomonadaceae bacterium]